MTFSGGGFQSNSVVTTRDDGKATGNALTDSTANFHHQDCFSLEATLGKHRLTADGTGANTAARQVAAYVTVVGAQQITLARTDTGSAASSGSGNRRLPYTGADLRDILLFGLSLLLLGAWLTRRGHQARAQRRALRATA